MRCLLLGASLRGAAVLAFAAAVEEGKAVVTIGAPDKAAHVAHNFSVSLEEITSRGEAQVDLGSRKFNIKNQFLDDLDNQEYADLGNLRKALLVMHSPLDTTVSIAEAEKIYVKALHPKSFFSGQCRPPAQPQSGFGVCCQHYCRLGRSLPAVRRDTYCQCQ
jgi:fermentation-respiration switch protein FrsA (DUF1100 family)